jgi:hypothetical protein
MNKTIKRFSGVIPCQGQDMSLLSLHDDNECLLETEWEGECGIKCPDYKPHTIKLCKKHRVEYICECEDCFDEYWNKRGRKNDRDFRRKYFIENKLHLKLKFSQFDRFGGWVLNIKPKLHKDYTWYINGKKGYIGIELTGLKRSLQIGFYLHPNKNYEQNK